MTLVYDLYLYHTVVRRLIFPVRVSRFYCLRRSRQLGERMCSIRSQTFGKIENRNASENVSQVRMFVVYVSKGADVLIWRRYDAKCMLRTRVVVVPGSSGNAHQCPIHYTLYICHMPHACYDYDTWMSEMHDVLQVVVWTLTTVTTKYNIRSS